MDFNLRTVLFCERLFEAGKYDEMFKAIGYPIPPDQKTFNVLLKLLNGNRFSASFMGDLEIKYKNGTVTKEEYIALKNIDKTFDFNADFDLVYGAFMEYYKIDLIDTPINYFKFKMLFEYICSDTDNPIINRMKIRSFEPVKGDGEDVIKYNNNMAKLKDKYSLE